LNDRLPRIPDDKAHREAQSVAEDVKLRDWFAGQALACLVGRLVGTELFTCQYRKLKHGRSGGEVRPGWRVT
jgi:hypothetical protein